MKKPSRLIQPRAGRRRRKLGGLRYVCWHCRASVPRQHATCEGCGRRLGLVVMFTAWDDVHYVAESPFRTRRSP